MGAKRKKGRYSIQDTDELMTKLGGLQVRARLFFSLYTRAHVCVCVLTYVCDTHACVCVCVCVLTYVCDNAHMMKCMCKYSHMFIHM